MTNRLNNLTNKELAQRIAIEAVDCGIPTAGGDQAIQDAIHGHTTRLLNELRPESPPPPETDSERLIEAVEVAHQSGPLGTDMLNLLYQVRKVRAHIPKKGDHDENVSKMFRVLNWELMKLITDFRESQRS